MRSGDLGRRVRWAATAGLVSLAAVACGGESNGPSDSPPESSPGGAGTGTAVSAKLSDFEIDLSEQAFAPGKYTFQAVNEGQVPRALEVQGSGLEESTDTLREGESADLTVTLSEGTYVVYCPLGNHRQLGMVTEITVGAGGAAPGEGPANGSGY